MTRPRKMGRVGPFETGPFLTSVNTRLVCNYDPWKQAPSLQVLTRSRKMGRVGPFETGPFLTSVNMPP